MVLLGRPDRSRSAGYPLTASAGFQGEDLRDLWGENRSGFTEVGVKMRGDAS
jgi:hypothetical protein